MKTIFAIHQFETALGAMVAIADETQLYFLAFADQRDLERRIHRLCNQTNSTIIARKTKIGALIEQEINDYCSGKLKEFKTPIALIGTRFQQSVWQQLKQISFGQTCSYSVIAQRINKPTAFRAVAQANGSNNLAIIIPCHRIINTDGKLGGYNAGIDRKQFLLDLEEKFKLTNQ